MGPDGSPAEMPQRRAPIDSETISHMINEKVLRRGFSQESLRSISLSTGRRNSIFIPRKLLFGGRPSFLWKLLHKGRGAGMRAWTKHVKSEGLGFMTGSEEM